jgi:hypothetical protein
VLYAAIANITILLENHTDHLEQAKSTASTIHHSLEKAATIADSWNENFRAGGSLGPYAVRITSPLTFLFLGNYGLPTSLSRNAALLLGGKNITVSLYTELMKRAIGLGFGEMVVKIRQFQWAQIWMWNNDHSSATAFTHLPQEQSSATT